MRNTLLRTAITLVCATAAATAFADDKSAETTTISGKGFIDFTNVKQDSNGVNTDASGTGIDVKRFYIGVDHKFDDMWSANVTTDFNYAGKTTETQETQVFIKKAYLQAKFDDAFVLRVGSADLPWIPFVENLYGYRYLEQVIVDYTKFGTSADWGLHAFGKFADGKVNYAVSLINGAGYKNPTRTKSVDIEGRLSVEPVKGLTFAAGFYNGKLGQETESNPAENTAQRFDLLAAYVAGPFRTGVEYFQAKNWKLVQTAVTPVPTDTTDGYSGWFAYSFTPEFGAFVRYDRAKLSKDLAPNLENKYFNLGLTYKPRKNVDLSFAYKQDKVANGSASLANGTIGGINGTTDGKFSEVGIWAQVVF
jgi:opacity protein-like surface antigen